MSVFSRFVPIRLILPGWPTNIADIPPQIDQIGLIECKTAGVGFSTLIASGKLIILDEIEFSLPLIPGLSFAVLNKEDYTQLEYEFAYLTDEFKVILKSLSASLRIQSDLLKRMEKVGNSYQEVPPDPVTGLPVPVEVVFEGADIQFNSGGEFIFTYPGEVPVLTILPFMIGNSGIVVDIASLKLILSEADAQSLPESIPSNWRGVYLEEATIHFTDLLADIMPETVGFKDAFIGSGGFSGSAFLETGITKFDETNARTLLGFGFALKKLDIEFKQNTLTRSSITGYLKLPFFEKDVLVSVGLSNEGDFTIGLGDLEIDPLTIPGVLTFDITSFELIKEGDSYAVKISGIITPLLGGLNWPSFTLNGIIINSDGTVKVEGGWIDLPELKALDFHNFNIEITSLGFGKEEENNIQYRWVGFSGGIQIVESVPLRGGMEGLKVMWPENGDMTLVKIKIGGVYLAFEVKNVIKMDGAVKFIDEGTLKEFRGGINLTLIPVNFALNAQFIAGRELNNDFNHFYIALGVDLPVGIPLGPPVLGLYGLAGLFGSNMSLKDSAFTYTGVENRPDLSSINNWNWKKDAMAFGAGLTVGTLPDVRFYVKVKALFVILIPGPVLIIEGHAGMMATAENYQMSVLAVLDPTVGSFLLNISATYQFPSNTGELVNINGAAEAFFSAADPCNWHLYLGEKEPEAKRIRADILSLFKAQTYLMIDPDGLKMGAWIGYGLDEKYGILRVILESWISGELALSTMPLQAKGSITLSGTAGLSAGIVSLGISVRATVAAQAPKPLKFKASLKVQLKTPLGNPKATISLKWENTKEPLYPVPLSVKLGIEHRKVVKNWEIHKYSPYKTDDDCLYLNNGQDALPAMPTLTVVPPDVYLVLNFDKHVIDLSEIAFNPAPITGIYEQVGDYEFKYELLSLRLESCDLLAAMDSPEWKDFTTISEDYTLSGSWQVVPGTSVENTKLILNATTPFEISRLLDTSDIWYNTLNVYNPDYPCPPVPEEQLICADFESRNPGLYDNLLIEDNYIFTSPFPMKVLRYNASWLGITKALMNEDNYFTTECLNIKAQEPTEQIKIKVINEVTITAGIGYDSFLKFTDEFSSSDAIELFINQSSLDTNKVPVFIHFPEAAFPTLPYKVWITCVVGDAPPVLFYAFDKQGTVVDTANLQGGSGDVRVYELSSDSAIIRKIGMIGYSIRIIEICYEQFHRVETASILVTPPQDLVLADLHLSKSSQGTVFMYDKENRELERINFDIPFELPDEDVQPVVLKMSNDVPFRSFLVTGNFKILKVCGLTEEAQEIYNYNAGLRNHMQTSLEEIWGKHTAQLLEPNKYYRLVIETTSSKRKGNEAWESLSAPFKEYMLFKTGNPPGPPAPTQTGAGDDIAVRYDLDGPLDSFAPYVNYTIPLGAAADEAQVLFYRSYDIGVVYNDTYLDQMYQKAGSPLQIRLLDNNNLPVLNTAGEELLLTNLWGDNPEMILTTEEEILEDILAENSCQIIMTLDTTETREEVLPSTRELLLKPLAQYKAHLLAGETKVYEFAFKTSRFSNFLHHVHSFQETVWNHFSLLQTTNYQLDQTLLEVILNNGEEEAVQFEQLMDFFDLNPRSLPEQLEIMLLNDQNRSYGFLLESPEALDWARITADLSYTSAITPLEETSPGILKIIGGSSEVTLINENSRISVNFNNQWIDLLLLEGVNLNGYSLQYETTPGEGVFEIYYTCHAASRNAGDMIRVFNGSSPAEVPVTEYFAFYSGHQKNLSSSEGRMFKLIDPAGNTCSSFVLYNPGTFASVTHKMIRNEDGSRMFLFHTNGAGLVLSPATGTYELSLSYLRDLGISYPLLRRYGFLSPEETNLRFILG